MKPSSPSAHGISRWLAGALVVALIVWSLMLTWSRPGVLPSQENPPAGRAGVSSPGEVAPLPEPFPHLATDSSKPAFQPTPSVQGREVMQKIAASASAIRRLYDQTQVQPAADATDLQASIQQQCEALKRLLREMPDDVATDGILGYLETQEDTPTSLPFDVEEGGTLNQAPSMRTLLLDLLGQTGPEESVAFAKRLFDRSQSPDEWALALRNLGWHDLEGENRPIIHSRFKQMTEREDWVQAPTDGFLEALDISVHLGFESTADLVASMIEARPPPVSSAVPAAPVEPATPVTHAATLALHRMAITDPAPMVERMGADPEYLDQAPSYRASLIARADVRDPAQAAALAAYLTQPNISQEEQRAFLAEFPNRNGILSNALVSTLPPHLEFEQNVAIDRASLAVVEQWIQTGLNPALMEDLNRTRDRLVEYVHAANLAISAPPNPSPTLDQPKIPTRLPDSN